MRNLHIENISDLELLRISKLDNLVSALYSFSEYLRKTRKYSDFNLEQEEMLDKVTNDFNQILEDKTININELLES